MRIAIVASPYVPVPPAQYGGTEQVIVNLIRGLQEAGHQPILLAPGDSRVDCPLIPVVDKALWFPKTTADRTEHQRKVDEAFANTARQLQKILPEIDVIHSHGFDLWPFRDFPNVTTLHGPVTFENLAYYKKRRSLPYISISQNQRGAFPDLNYVGTAYNGEDPSEFPLVTKPEEDYVCFLGRFDREKNPHMAIELALSHGIKIKLAGKIDYLSEGYFDKEVAKYFDHPLVEYLGELGFDDKIELISSARCNLHPTGFREPFGLTVIEAAYCGTPTIAIARGALPELIEQGKSGILVEDFVQAHSYFKKALSLDRRYVARRARRLFNYRRMTRQYIKAYATVLAQHRVSWMQTELFGRGSNTLSLPNLQPLWDAATPRPLSTLRGMQRKSM